MHTRLLQNKPSDGFGMGFGSATAVVLVVQTRENQQLEPKFAQVSTAIGSTLQVLTGSGLNLKNLAIYKIL